MGTVPPFSIVGIDHLGIVPKDIKQARWFFASVLGLPDRGSEIVASEGVRVQMLTSKHDAPHASVQAEETTKDPKLELLEPEGATNPLTSYLEKKGGGIHHLAFRVTDIRAAVAYLKQQGVLLINETPRSGAHGSEIVFVHPKSTGGILVELVAKR